MRRQVTLAVILAVVAAGCGGNDKPTTPELTGACCAPAGICTVTTQANCTGTGRWTLGGDCDPNTCLLPPPTGACCARAGTCTVTTQTSCAGTWALNGVCVPNTCPPPPPPTGACCAPVGTCTVTTLANCTGTDTWTLAGICEPNACPQPPVGSCCALAGTCTATTQANCTGTDTWTLAGVCDPNICPQPPPTGSCCALAGTCTVTTQADCSGVWTPHGVCTQNPCMTPSGTAWIPPGDVRLGQAGVAYPINDFYLDGFYIDRYEVSNAQYEAFIEAGGYTTEAYWNPVGWAWRVANSIELPDNWGSDTYHGGGIAGNERFPVNGVSWWEADAYCRWAGARLPTEAEWEKAAKGGCEILGDSAQCDPPDTPTYPWGEHLTGPRANYYESGDPYENNGWTTPVGYYDGSDHDGYQTTDSPSPYGLYDVLGNVWEWCSTNWGYSYPYDPNDGRESPPATSNECCRVLHGGSYAYGNAGDLRCAYRGGGYPWERGGNVIGFRCVRTLH